MATAASDPSDDLAFIRKTMEDARRTVDLGGIFYVLWGSLCVLGTAASYLAAWLGAAGLIGAVWIAVALAGAVAMIPAARGRGSRTKTFASGLMGVAWGCAILVGAVFEVGAALSGTLTLESAMAGVSASIALGFLLSAAIARSRAMALLSVPWWLGGLFIGTLPAMTAPLALGSLTLLFELIPGIVIVARRKGREHEAEA